MALTLIRARAAVSTVLAARTFATAIRTILAAIFTAAGTLFGICRCDGRSSHAGCDEC